MSAKLTAEEIKLIRTSLHWTEKEMAKQLELRDRMEVTQLETGRMRPTPKLQRRIFKVLTRHKMHSRPLKKLYEELKERNSSSL